MSYYKDDWLFTLWLLYYRQIFPFLPIQLIYNFFFNLIFRACVKKCEETGCIGQKCFPQCKFSSEGVSIEGPWYMQEPLYLRWKQWDCQSDCRYYCMLDREKEREASGNGPVKYHGKWPFKRVYGIQVCLQSTYLIKISSMGLVLDIILVVCWHVTQSIRSLFP